MLISPEVCLLPRAIQVTSFKVYEIVCTTHGRFPWLW